MRITDNMRYRTLVAGQQRAAERMTKLSEEASTGARVNAPSDDPAAYSRIATRDALSTQLDDRAKLASQAADDLDAADGALASAGDLMIRARELAVEMADGGADAIGRANAAKEVDSIRTQLLVLANTRGAHGYVFGGTKTDTAPFDPSGAFSGNDNQIRVDVGGGVTLASNVSGARAFTAAGGTDVLATLQTFSAALSANDQNAIRASISQIDAAHGQILGARADAGIGSERLRSVADVSQTAMTSMKAARAVDADADAPQVYTDLTAAQLAYQRGVEVTRSILSTLSQGN